MTVSNDFGSGNGHGAAAASEERSQAAPSRTRRTFREPATFAMRCLRGHRWWSYGQCETGEGRTRWPLPEQPTCPIKLCGQGWVAMSVFTGDNQPQIVEAGT